MPFENLRVIDLVTWLSKKLIELSYLCILQFTLTKKSLFHRFFSMKVVSLDIFFKTCFEDGGLKLKPLMSQEMLFFFLDSPEKLIKQ